MEADCACVVFALVMGVFVFQFWWVSLYGVVLNCNVLWWMIGRLCSR